MRHERPPKESPGRLRELLFYSGQTSIERSERGAHVGIGRDVSVDLPRLVGSDVGRLALPTDDDALFLQDAERPLDGADRDAVAGRHVGVAWQPLPWAQLAALDIAPDGINHLKVLRTRVVRIKFLHIGQATPDHLGRLAVSILPSMSKRSIFALVATAPVADTKAPTSVAALAGAEHRTHGGTMQVDRTRMYRVNAVAELVDVSVSTVYRAIESGALDVLRIGKALRVPGPALAAWLEQCAQDGYATHVLAGIPADDVEDDTTAAGAVTR